MSNLKSNSNKHYIITSTNEIDLYIEFVPSTYQMWKKNLECVYILCFVTNRDKDDPLVKRLRQFCDELYLFKPVINVHTGIQAKVIRMWMASQFGENICTLTDIDQYLFDFNWLKQVINPAFDQGKFVEIGHNAYWETNENGKFPMYYTTSPSDIFNKIINPKKLNNFEEWFLQFKNIKDPIDNKEQIGPNFNIFSDESLLRYLIERHPDKEFINNIIVKVIRQDFKQMKASRRLDRAGWPNIKLSDEILEKANLLDCNPLRPFNKYVNNILPILRWMKLNVSKENIIL